MESNIYQIIKKQHKSRLHRGDIPAIKINLYKNYEVYAVKEAIEQLIDYPVLALPDCFMVGDSLLNTHLRRSSTRLSSAEGKEIFLNVVLNAVAEVRTAINSCFQASPQPYLIADLPCGSLESAKSLVSVAESMLLYGADVVKLEVSSLQDVRNIELLTGKNIPVMAHIGYTPQKSENRQYGISLEESLYLFKLAQEGRNCGACALVLERVNEIVNQALCTSSENSLPVYSIFSGKAKYGGQCLNVWDSVYRPSFRSFYFPASSLYNVETYPQTYTHENIRKCFQNLLESTIKNGHPKSPPNRMLPDDVEFIQSINPWTYTFHEKPPYRPFLEE